MVVKFSQKRKRKKEKARKESDCSNGRTSNKLTDLPLEIIFDIFSRLSAVTLSRLRSVCKLWNNLTRDPGFIDLLHLRRKLKLKLMQEVPPSHLIFASETTNTQVWDTKRTLFLIDGVEEEGTCRAIEIYLEKNRFDLVGSCNGLVCLASVRKFGSIIICNPITGESWCLPPNSKLEDFFLTFGPMTVPRIGFGFDHATGKYKVIRFLYDDQGQLLGKIITLGERSWRNFYIPVTKGGQYGNKE
ncbi:F-box protein At3g07870-like [Telopea speciosissima]|uniref:F-box protein At3g07870-like n=1 Tax=Telopea speciosissima TaxID=54955 RepID=UPI001CC66CEB|nr:F-box protein At3g07870-like [Telopea speciosissima]